MPKRITAIWLCMTMLAAACCAFAEALPAEETSRTARLAARCVSVEEGQALMRGRTLFHEQINEVSLDFFMQKKGGTLEEYIEYSAEQVLPFTPEEEQQIRGTLAWLQQQMESHGLKLPDPGVINFVKTTGKEAFGAAGYTSEGNVFLAEVAFIRYPEEVFHDLVVHEIFHCLSRLFPEYRKALYSLIHFTVLEEDIDIPQELRDRFIANPDVEQHNATALFTIGGERRECYLLFMTDDVFEKPGDTFFHNAYSGVVPLGESALYRADDVPDFWDVVGRNTDYAEDPEEIMAANFASAILHLDDGYAGFANPEILEGIIEYLKAD